MASRRPDIFLAMPRPGQPGGAVMAVQAPRGSDTSVVIETVRLNKFYKGVHALRDLSLQVHEGDVFGFLGPNGAGKTTFTKCLLGFVKPSTGHAYLFGRSLDTDDRSILSRVGIVPDQFGFYPNLTGRAHLDFYARLYGIGARDREARIEELTRLVRLEHRMDSKVGGYSHGMRQRLVIAHALLNDPDLIIFDEPTTGLDPKGAYEVRQLLRQLATRGVTTFLSSHILFEVEEICTKVGILNRGVLMKLATVADLKREFAGGSGQRVEIVVERATQKALAAARAVAGVVEVQGEGQTIVATVADADRVPDVVEAVVVAGARVRGVTERMASLEEMFLHYTDDGAGPGAPQAPTPPAGVYASSSAKRPPRWEGVKK